MASYLPATNARAIRLSYTLYGGPQTAQFAVTHAVAAGFALGQVVAIGEHWIGEVVTKRRMDDYQTEVILSGLARRLEGLYWRGRYNTTKDDGTPEYGSQTAADLGAVLTDLRPILQSVGLDWTETLSTGIVPMEAEFQGTVREILDNIAQAAGMAWTVDTVQSAGRYLVRFRSITLPAPGTPEEVSAETVRNVLVIEGAPKPPFNRDGKTDAEAWAYYTDLEDFTGLYGDGLARFHSERRIWVYQHAASVATYGRREERVSVPYIGDGAATSGSAWQLAQTFFANFAQPRASTKRADVIQGPGPAAHESLPWEVGARAVDVAVLPAGGATIALRADYKTSTGELLNSALFRSGAAIRAIPGKGGVDDRTPPTVTLSTSQPADAQGAPELGAPAVFYATAVDRGTGVRAVELTLRGTHHSTGLPHAVTLAMVQDGADPTRWGKEYNWAGQFRRGTKLEAYARAVDGAGNYAFSAIGAHTLDKDPPVVTVSVENTGTVEDPGAASYAQVTGPFKLWINVQDKSKATKVEVWANNVMRSDITANWDEESKRYFFTSTASSFNGKHRFQARVTDAFGQTTTSQEFYLEGRRKGTDPGTTTNDWADGAKEEDGLATDERIHGTNVAPGTMPADRLAGGLPAGDAIQETVGGVTRRWGWTPIGLARGLALTVASVVRAWFTDTGDLVPASDGGQDLGAPDQKWYEVFTENVTATNWGIDDAGWPLGGLKSYIDASGGGSGGFAERLELTAFSGTVTLSLVLISNVAHLVAKDQAGNEVFRFNLEADEFTFGDPTDAAKRMILRPRATGTTKMLEAPGWSVRADGVATGIRVGFKQG
jgi:hypothetical protein